MASADRDNPRDPTPAAGAQTDVARLGRSTAKPTHERTADEDADVVDWNAINAAPEFTALLKAKRRFIIPATVFFVIYYFALPYLVGYHTEMMQRKAWGEMNWAYLFALSQFFMAWILAAVYVVVAAGWDRKAKTIVERAGK
ncbi:MAG TPA: DUF485 domain-containing protein [Chthoniobacterales bacterium]|nr:DUF485 domain-containing protein [Chthoniobacterales bacterium]